MTSSPAAIYLDHAASSPLLPEALEAMLPFLSAGFANPSSPHSSARAVRRALDDARESLAELFGCEPGELIFTSGGTESDNLALKGALSAREGTLVTSAVEHHAVLNLANRVGARIAGVDTAGRVDLGDLESLLDDSVVVVSVMAANNETGVVQPLAEVVEVVRGRAPTAFVHTDAVQAFPALDPKNYQSCDLVSFSAHKFGGPKGVGALIVREPARPFLRPLLEGGAQESELRAGTENVPGIVGMGAAAAIAVGRREALSAMRARRDRLAAGILASVPGASLSGAAVERLPSICHVVLPGFESEELLLLLDEEGVAASAGAACASGALEPSHVLLAMGRSTEEARQVLRLSLSSATTDAEVEGALEAISAAVGRLRAR